jgi:hypothetical protein
MPLNLMLNPPDTFNQTHDRVAELTRENNILRAQVGELILKLQRSDERAAMVEGGVSRLRSALTPLYQALQQIYGDIDAMEINPESGSGMDPRKAAVWEDWKRKMPGIPARFIEALMLHGELTQTQLRLHAKCAQGSVAGVVSQLWKAGLINKNGGKISLKEL